MSAGEELEASAEAVAAAARALVRAAGAEAFGGGVLSPTEAEELERLRRVVRDVERLADTWMDSGLETYRKSHVKTEEQAAREVYWKLGRRGRPDDVKD